MEAPRGPQTLKIGAPGALLSRPAGEPEAGWKEVAKTPAEVLLNERMAQVLLRDGRAVEAEKAFRDSLKEDPKNAEVVYVAASGDLFKADPERGLYKTIDGGRTWTKSKFIDDDSGFVDVAMDPSNSQVLIAASYQRRRTVWGTAS